MHTLLGIIPGTSRDNILIYVNSLTQCSPWSVCAIRTHCWEGHQKRRGAPSIRLEKRDGINNTIYIKHLLSGPAKNAADSSCVSWIVFHSKDLGYLCLSLFLTHIHIWIVSQQSVVQPDKQKNETDCSQTMRWHIFSDGHHPVCIPQSVTCGPCIRTPKILMRRTGLPTGITIWHL